MDAGKAPARTGAGTILKSRYRLLEKIGSGGFGEVYLAADIDVLGRKVVVKIPRRDADDWALLKFQQEMEALARVAHPGIVGLLDAGKTPDGKQFLVMQYIEGRSLRGALEGSRSGVSFAFAADVIRQLGSALKAAHQCGVVHRDLKPENILLQKKGNTEHVFLIDFGIARIRDSFFATETSHVAGTLAYMAPEQLDGKASAQSDIHALGVLMYEMLTGVLPFGNGEGALFRKVQGISDPATRWRPDLPAALDGMLGAALAPAAEDRPGDAEAYAERVAGELEAAPSVDPNEIPTRISPAVSEARRNGRRMLWAAIVAVLLLVTAGVGYWRNRTAAVKTQAEVSYSVLVQPFRDGDWREPVRSTAAAVFGPKDRLALTLRSTAAGFLFVLNETAGIANGVPEYRALLLARGTAQYALRAGEELRVPREGWFQLDTGKGSERLFVIVCSEIPEPLREASARVGKTEGALELDRAESMRLRTWLDKEMERKNPARSGGDGRETVVAAGQLPLVHRIVLDYQ